MQTQQSSVLQLDGCMHAKLHGYVVFGYLVPLKNAKNIFFHGHRSSGYTERLSLLGIQLTSCHVSAASDFDIMMPDAPVRPAEPAVLPEGRLGSLLRPRRAALRRAVSFMDRPTGRNKSPGTPTSNTGAASLGSGGRHQSLPSLIITSHR